MHTSERDAAFPLRTATAADLDTLASVLTAAFFDDPVWGPAFPDREQRSAVASAYWRFVVADALHHETSRVATAPDGSISALAVWFPPHAPEISEAALPAYDALLAALLDPTAAASLHEAGDRFAAARPAEPHAYLTLLAVAPEHRGRGAGMGLLRATLNDYDAAGVPTYLESSNPSNDRRYEALGYRAHGRVELANGTGVQTYWRDPAA